VHISSEPYWSLHETYPRSAQKWVCPGVHKSASVKAPYSLTNFCQVIY